MYTLDKNLFIKEILLDNNNPRFGKTLKKSQIELQEELLNNNKSSELLASMKSRLIWVNKIVVAPIEDLSLKEKESLGVIPLEKKYIVIEGNTRLACLMHESMRKVFNEKYKIPVLIAKRSEGENDNEYLISRKRIQSISNVMVVKDWDEIPKAKQLYESYKLIKELDKAKSENVIFKELGEDIGITLQTVKAYIYRYIFFKEISDNSNELIDDDFKYFEIFERNNNIRNLFGYSTENSDFCWNITGDELSENDSEIIEKKKELLFLMPKIIKIAKNENKNSKKLRDMLGKFKPKDLEDLLQTFKDIIKESKSDEYSYDSLENKLQPEYDYEEKKNKEYKALLSKLKKMLKNFPVNQDYAKNFKNDLLDINLLVNNILECFKVTK